MRIEARGLAAGFPGRRPVLEGVDVALGPGELVGLLGPNGSGKTTLLRTLAGLLPPRAGALLYDGAPAAALPRRGLARRLAVLPQGDEAEPALTVAATVALGRLPHRGRLGGVSEDDRAAVSRALARVGAAGWADRPLGTLSGGERRRVLLARALAVEAESLLADEPVAALDPRHALAIMGLLREATRAGQGAAVVLHDLSLAARFCDRLLLLSGGRVLAAGPPDEVLTDGALAAAFGVEVARGTRDGRGFLLPWRALDREGGPGRPLA